jgi:predicted Zn-dependent peptidase
VDLGVLIGMLGKYLEYFGREEHLVYGVSADFAPFRDHVDVYLGCSFEGDKTLRVTDWLFSLLREFKVLLTQTNLTTFRENLVKTTRMDLPYPKATLDNLAWHYYYFGQPLTTEQEIELIERVQLDNLIQLYEVLFEGPTSTLQISGHITEALKRGVEKIYSQI